MPTTDSEHGAYQLRHSIDEDQGAERLPPQTDENSTVLCKVERSIKRG